MDSERTEKLISRLNRKVGEVAEKGEDMLIVEPICKIKEGINEINYNMNG